MPQFRDPPSNVTGALAEWLRDVATWINSMPSMSRVSFAVTATPNSIYSGTPGDFLVNVASASTNSRLWHLGGAVGSARTTLGWQLVRIVAP